MVDVDRMRKKHEEQQKGGDFLQFDTGDTLVYVHPECREAEDEWEPTAGCSFVPVVVHYGVGGKGMAVSLDPETNPIIKHPFIVANLKKKKVRLTGKCPMKEALSDGTIEGEDADTSRGQTRYMFGMTVLGYRRDSKAEFSMSEGKPSVAFVGKQILDGIMSQYYDNGDISDPAAAYLLRITKEGKDRNTKYSVKAEPKYLKKPYVLSKDLKAKVDKAIAADGDCDLFRIVSNMIKTPAEVSAMIAGVKVSSDPDDDDEIEEEDDEAELPPPKKKAKAPPVEEEEEEAPPPVKKKPKAAPPPDGDDDDEEPPPPVKKKKPAPPPEEEEEEEAPPPPKKKAKAPPPPADDEEKEEEAPAPKPKKKAVAPPPEDEDELELEDLESALENLEEEEAPAPKPKKKAVAPPPDDDDDDEEPPPPVKKKK